MSAIDFTAQTPGVYCFRAEYHPSDTAPYSPATHTNETVGGTAGECFHVTLPPPMLTVRKLCIGTNTGTFHVTIDGNSHPVGCRGKIGPMEVPAGVAQTVSEAPAPGFTTTLGGACRTGSVTVPDGESRTCWITNARTGEPSAFLTVDKVCEPTTTGRFNVLVDSGEFGDNLECGQSTDAVRVGVGTHTVKEAGGTDTSLGDYTTEISCVTPTGTTTGGSVTLTDGQSATCTITNRQKPATLTVIKECVPTTDGGHFDITFTGPTPFTTPAVRCGGSTGPIAVTPGRYKVSENGALGTDLAAYTQLKGGTATPAASSTSLRANP